MNAANEIIQSLIEDLEYARRLVNHQAALMEVALPLTNEDSTLESLLCIAVDTSANSLEWINRSIASGKRELSLIESAPQNATSKNVARKPAEVRP